MTDPTADDRLLASFRALVRAEFPHLTYAAPYQYAIQVVHGAGASATVDVSPVDTSIVLPTLAQVPLLPIVGWTCTPSVGSQCVIQFLNSDPTRPVCTSIDGAPGAAAIAAGGMVAVEHLMTTEAVALLIYNTWVALLLTAGGGPLTAVILQPLLGAAVVAALTAQGVPAPPGLVAQAALAAAQLPTFAAGTTPATTSAFFQAAIGGVASKTPNVSGLFPSLGCPAVEAG
jgi:hypothetical protein